MRYVFREQKIMAYKVENNKNRKNCKTHLSTTN